MVRRRDASEWVSWERRYLQLALGLSLCLLLDSNAFVELLLLLHFTIGRFSGCLFPPIDVFLVQPSMEVVLKQQEEAHSDG